jgi:hypothetical protein
MANEHVAILQQGVEYGSSSSFLRQQLARRLRPPVLDNQSGSKIPAKI